MKLLSIFCSCLLLLNIAHLSAMELQVDVSKTISLEDATLILNTIINDHVKQFETENNSKELAESITANIITCCDDALILDAEIFKQIIENQVGGFLDAQELNKLIEEKTGAKQPASHKRKQEDAQENEEESLSVKKQKTDVQNIQNLIKSYCQKKNPETLKEIQKGLQELFCDEATPRAALNEIIKFIQTENEEKVCETFEQVLNQNIAQMKDAQCLMCSGNQDLTYWSYNCFSHAICKKDKSVLKQEGKPCPHKEHANEAPVVKKSKAEEEAEKQAALNKQIDDIITQYKNGRDYFETFESLEKTLKNHSFGEMRAIRINGNNKDAFLHGLANDKNITGGEYLAHRLCMLLENMLNEEESKSNETECPVCSETYEELALKQTAKEVFNCCASCLHPICKNCKEGKNATNTKITQCPICLKELALKV